MGFTDWYFLSGTGGIVGSWRYFLVPWGSQCPEPRDLNYLSYCAKSWEAALVRFIFARTRMEVSVGPSVDCYSKGCASPLLEQEVMAV